MMTLAPTRTRSVLLILTLLISASSCSKADTEAAERGVEKFHVQYNQEQYQAIYNEASEEFRKAASEQDLANLLSAVRRKFGTVKSSKLEGSQVNSSTDGTTITLTYETQFEQGKSSERFIWRGSGDQVKLLRFDIKSPDLVEK